MKSIKYLIIILLLPVLSFGQIQIGSDIEGVTSEEWTGYSVSMSADGNRVATGAIWNNDNGVFAGTVRVFELQNGNWFQLGQNLDGEASGDSSGFRISLSADGNIIAISSRRNGGNGPTSGHVRLYRFQNGSWLQIGQDINGTQAGDQLGSAVCLSSDGNIVAIGALFNDDNGADAGQVRIFENQNETWVQIGDAINGVAPGDRTGESLSLSGDGSIVAIGAPGNDDNGMDSGQVRVFENQNGNWVQIGADINGEASYILASDGVSLSSSGNVLAIGDSGLESSFVRVFENQNGTWIQIGEKISRENSTEFYGQKVHISGDGNTVAIGDERNAENGTNSGLVQVYQNQNGDWIQIGEDIVGEEFDISGFSVHLSKNGGVLAIGAPGHNLAGIARVYNLAEPLSSKEVFNTKFSITPNPTGSNFTISLAEEIQIKEVIIYNSLGRIVSIHNDTTIDASSLLVGVYFVEVITAQGNGIQKLIRK